MAKQKPKMHKEHFCKLAKTSCPCGGTKRAVWGWYEYKWGKKRLIVHFCWECFDPSVKQPMLRHKDPCGCNFILEIHDKALSGDVVPSLIEKLQAELNGEEALCQT